MRDKHDLVQPLIGKDENADYGEAFWLAMAFGGFIIGWVFLLAAF